MICPKESCKSEMNEPYHIYVGKDERVLRYRCPKCGSLIDIVEHRTFISTQDWEIKMNSRAQFS